MNWKSLAPLALMLVVAFAVRELFPKTVTVGRNVPTIVTKHDTVRTRWTDTLYRVKVTTDTFNLVIHETIHDTVQVYVGADTAARPKLWPLLSYEQRQGHDSATLRTFDLRNGRGAESLIFAPGPVTGIFADTGAVPRINFGAWPTPHTSWLTKLLWGGIGYGICKL